MEKKLQRKEWKKLSKNEGNHGGESDRCIAVTCSGRSLPLSTIFSNIEYGTMQILPDTASVPYSINKNKAACLLTRHHYHK